MISESELRALEQVLSQGYRGVDLTWDEARQLVNAARLANAAAILDRERGDYKRNSRPLYESQQTRFHLDRAQAAFDRAMRSYSDTVTTAGVLT